MGIYLNPSAGTFKQCLNAEIYVDKSMIIDELNRRFDSIDSFFCVSRPRRFGKSMAGNMISAYYSRGADSRSLFAGLKISQTAKFEDHLNKYNVIKLDINGFYQCAADKELMFNDINSYVRQEFKVAYPDIDFAESDGIAMCVSKVYAATGVKFVIIIDEYDVLVRERVPKSLFEKYLSFLSGLFKNSTLREAIGLAYLTGILPIVRDRIQSKMNEFLEYSMLESDPLSSFVGFTNDEVKALCERFDMDFPECRRWYDGYRLDGCELYAPRSVSLAMAKRRYGSYWTSTGSFEALKDYILMNFEGIKDDVVKMVGGASVKVDVGKYMNTMDTFHSKDEVFAYLIHIGYLSYDNRRETCRIPNEEVRKEWVRSVEDSADYRPVMETINASGELLDATIAGDADAVAAALGHAHDLGSNPLTYNSEAALQCAIGLAYFYANTRYTVVKELPSGRGYADLALIPFVPNIPAIVIELKMDGAAAGALGQIRERKYDTALQGYRGDMRLVGVTYDRQTKRHACRIETLDY